MGKACICEICNCGRHHCPHRQWRPGGDFGQCMITSYNTTFKQHAIVPRESFKPNQTQMRSNDPLSDQTTFRTDYIKHPLEKPFVHTQDQYKRPQGEIDAMTSYKKDYNEKHAPPAQMIKHDGQRALPARFEGEPTYKNDYRQWPIERVEGKKPEAWVPSNKPFEGQSTFTRDYRKYNEPPRQSLRPNQATHMSDSPFDGNTGYRDDYIKHPLKQREQKEKEHYKPSNVPFDGMTTFNRDFTKKHGLKTESCKPNSQAYQSDAPLDDMTTFRNDYRKWNGERPYVHVQGEYVRPEGEIDLNTTNKLQFKAHPAQRIAMVKPGDGGVKFPGEFSGMTNYKADFKPWEMTREQPKPREGWVPSNVPFEGCATYKSHFTKHNQAPPKSMKPNASNLASNAPFEDATMYRTEFIRKAADICPAAVLGTKVSPFCYVETDPKGHKQYAPCQETITPMRRISSANAPRVPASVFA